MSHCLRDRHRRSTFRLFRSGRTRGASAPLLHDINSIYAAQSYSELVSEGDWVSLLACAKLDNLPTSKGYLEKVERVAERIAHPPCLVIGERFKAMVSVWQTCKKGIDATTPPIKG